MSARLPIESTREAMSALLTGEVPSPSTLRFQAEAFRLLVESVQDYAIFMLDPDGRVATWNAGAERIKGYKAEEIIGSHFSRFYPPEDQGKPAVEIEIALAEGRVEDTGWRLRKDGSRFWANVIITAVYNPEGQLVGFAKVTRDFTERQKADEALRQSEERFRLLVESVQDYAIFMLDPDGRVATWNAGAERIKGYKAEEIIGSHFSRFYPPEDQGKPAAEIEVALAEGRVEDTGWRLRKDGTRFWANVIITALRDREGRLRGFAKVTRDLTARRLAEETERRLLLEAAQRQGAEEHVARLEKVEAELRAAVNVRDEFLSIASHELKTPLTPLHLKVQMLRRDVEASGGQPLAASRLLPALASMERQVGRLSVLVNDLLDVARISAGKLTLHPERFDFAEVLREVMGRFSHQAQQNGCELELLGPETLPGCWDRIRMEQVVSNLLSNALKYGAGKPVSVRLEPRPGGLELIVRDQGIGIGAEHLSRIFERFERAVSDRHYGGLGLGLYITQQILQTMGGSIRAESRLGQGATFIVRLPLESPAQEPRSR